MHALDSNRYAHPRVIQVNAARVRPNESHFLSSSATFCPGLALSNSRRAKLIARGNCDAKDERRKTGAERFFANNLRELSA